LESKELIEVNYETIRELKLRGKGLEANELLNKYRNNTKQNKIQLKKELMHRHRMMKKAWGICVNCQNPALEGKSHCERCATHYK